MRWSQLLVAFGAGLGCTAVSVPADPFFISGIEEDLQPPRHEELQHLEFMEVLRVDPVNNGITITNGHKVEIGHVHEGGRGYSWMPLRLWLDPLRSLKVTGLAQLLNLKWPTQDMGEYQDPKELGQGAFGVTYLATKRDTSEKVAVKLLKIGDIWASSFLYNHHPERLIRDHIDSSRQECINIKKIHEGQSKDPDGAKHVVQCLYDGISPNLQDPFSEKPLYIVMNFVGKLDFDKWWTTFQKNQKFHKEYVMTFKRMIKGMFTGLRFLGENPTDTKWVHHDLKPQNMVVDDETKELTVVDMGTTLPTTQPNLTAACTPIFRPPEVCPWMWLASEVGFQQPAWAYDVFSAGATILAMAGDTSKPYHLTGGQLGLLPYYTFYMQEIIQHSMVRVDVLKATIECGKIQEMKGNGNIYDEAKAFAEGFYQCAEDSSIKHFSALNAERMNLIQGSTGDVRKAALAALVNCRNPPVQLPVLNPAFRFGAPNPTVAFWTLLEDWMATGFDEVLLKALGSDPNARPKPSEILESQWFKTQETSSPEGQEIEYSCPEPGMNEGTTLQILVIVFSVIQLLSLCTCCGGGVLSLRAGIPMWKWMLPLSGALVVTVPVAEYYVVSWKYFWLLVMVPLGLTMIILGASMTPQLQAKFKIDRKWYYGVVAAALLMTVGVCIDHIVSLSGIPHASAQLRVAHSAKVGLQVHVPNQSQMLDKIKEFLDAFLAYTFWSLASVVLSTVSLAITVNNSSTESRPEDVELPRLSVEA